MRPKNTLPGAASAVRARGTWWPSTARRSRHSANHTAPRVKRKNRKASGRFVRRSRVWTRAARCCVRSRKAGTTLCGTGSISTRTSAGFCTRRASTENAGGSSLKIFPLPRVVSTTTKPPRATRTCARRRPCSRRAVSPSTPPATPRTRAAPRSAATWSRGARTGTSTTPTCAFCRARSAPSPRASKTTPPATRCAARRTCSTSRRCAAASPRRGRAEPPRCACRAAYTPSSPARPTSHCSAPPNAARRRCTCTRFRRWRCGTARRRSREARCAGTSLRFWVC